jgi:RIO-like serine/threonine protein kinase
MGFRARLEPVLAAAVPSSPEAAWRRILDAPAVSVLARSRTTETVVATIDGFGRVVRKRWTWPRRRDRAKGALRTTWAARSPARREFEALARLVALPGGPFAPAPLGFLEERSHGVLRACVLVETEIDGAVDLARRLVDSSPGRARTRLLARLARRTREMHDAGLVDFDMHPRNVLVAPATDDVFKVDCAKQRLRGGPASERDRARDLAALDVGLTRLATDAERAAFFSAYGANRPLVEAVDRGRRRIDERESKRLPPRR